MLSTLAASEWADAAPWLMLAAAVAMIGGALLLGRWLTSDDRRR